MPPPVVPLLVPVAAAVDLPLLHLQVRRPLRRVLAWFRAPWALASARAYACSLSLCHWVCLHVPCCPASRQRLLWVGVVVRSCLVVVPAVGTVLEGHSKSVVACSWSPGSDTLASGCVPRLKPCSHDYVVMPAIVIAVHESVCWCVCVWAGPGAGREGGGGGAVGRLRCVLHQAHPQGLSLWCAVSC